MIWYQYQKASPSSTHCRKLWDNPWACISARWPSWKFEMKWLIVGWNDITVCIFSFYPKWSQWYSANAIIMLWSKKKKTICNQQVQVRSSRRKQFYCLPSERGEKVLSQNEGCCHVLFWVDKCLCMMREHELRNKIKRKRTWRLFLSLGPGN